MIKNVEYIEICAINSQPFHIVETTKTEEQMHEIYS